MQNVTDNVSVPKGVTAERVTRSLGTGLGYRWTYLEREPSIVAHAEPTRGEVPELTLLGRTILIWGSSDEFAESLRRILRHLGGSHRA